MDVSKSKPGMNSWQCKVNWYRFKGFTIKSKCKGAWSNAGTWVPWKVTWGCTHVRFRRKCAREVVMTHWYPSSDTSAIGNLPYNPTKNMRKKQVPAIKKIIAKTTSKAATWQICLVASGVWRKSTLEEQLLQEARSAEDTWPRGCRRFLNGISLCQYCT